MLFYNINQIKVQKSQRINKTIIRYLIIVLVLNNIIDFVSCLKNYYPNCIRSLNISEFTLQNAIYYNQDFLNLTSFLYNPRQQQQKEHIETFLNFSKSGNYQQIAHQKSQTLYSKLIIVILIILSILTLIFYRVFYSHHNKKSSKNIKINKIRFENRGKAFIVYGICFVIIGFGFFVIINIKNLWVDISNSVCYLKLFPDMLKYGDQKYNWDGIEYQKDKINNSIELIQYVQFSNHSIYNYTTTQISHQIKIVGNQKNRLSWLFEETKVAMEVNSTYNNSVNLKDVVNNLAGSQSFQQNISLIINGLQLLAQYSETLYDSIQNFLYSISQNKAILSQSLQYLSKQDEDTQKIYLLSKDSVLNQNVKMVQITIKIIQAITSISLVSTFIIITSVVLLQIRYLNVMYKIYAVFWYIEIVLFVLLLLALMTLQFIQYEHEISCSGLNQLINNQTAFHQVFTTQIKDPNYMNIFYSIETCLFEKTSSNNNFLEKLGILTPLTPIINLFSNQTNFFEINRIGNPNYINILSYKKQLEKLSRFLNRQKFCEQNSTLCKYSNTVNLLNNLNQYSYSDVASQQCYKDYWVVDWSQCLSNISIISNGNHTPYNSSQSYLNKKVTCLTFNVLNSTFKTYRSLTQTEFIEIYKNSQTECPNSFTKIMQFGLLIIENLQNQQRSISPIETQIQILKTQIEQLNTYLRTFYQCKKKQFQEVFYTYATISPTTKDQDLNYFSKGNNCSAIKYHIQSGYSTYCYNLKSSLRKLILCAIVVFIFKGLLIFVGYIHSINYKALYENQKIIDEPDNEAQYTQHSEVFQQQQQQKNNSQKSQKFLLKKQSSEHLQFQYQSQDDKVSDEIISIENKNLNTKKSLAYSKYKNQKNLKEKQTYQRSRNNSNFQTIDRDFINQDPSLRHKQNQLVQKYIKRNKNDYQNNQLIQFQKVQSQIFGSQSKQNESSLVQIEQGSQQDDNQRLDYNEINLDSHKRFK